MPIPAWWVRKQKEDTEAARAARLAEAPRRTHGLYRKAWGGRERAAAVRCYCLECVGWSPAEVRRCTSPACPLWEFRMGRRFEGAAERARATTGG